jgi:hypothetical protein
VSASAVAQSTPNHALDQTAAYVQRCSLAFGPPLISFAVPRTLCRLRHGQSAWEICNRFRLQRVLEVVEWIMAGPNGLGSCGRRIPRSFGGLDATSSRLRRRGPGGRTVTRFRGWESPDDSGPGQRARACGPHPPIGGRITPSRGGDANSTPRHGPELGAGSDGGRGPAVAQSRACAADQLRRSEPPLSLAA